MAAWGPLMYVVELHLINYRNYQRLDLELPPGPLVVLGANAQGKSNLVDALHILATGRSLRGGPEASWIHLDAPESAPFARISAVVERAGGRIDLELIVARTNPGAGAASGVRRRVRVGGAPRRLSELPGRLQVVSFCPTDLTLLTGPLTDRRRWLDIALAQLDRRYLQSLSSYEALLSRRNAVLRRIQAQFAQPDELSFWDERLAEPAVDVLARRQTYIEVLAPLAAAEFSRAAALGTLTVAYRATAPCAEPAAFRARLLERRARDIGSGATGVGPHRDDITAALDGRPLAHFGSRGQIRLAALAIKFAQFELARRRSGEAPVFLLDDIAAELDPQHRRLLLGRLPPGVQTLVTSADPAALESEALQNAPRLEVGGGTVRQTCGAA